MRQILAALALLVWLVACEQQPAGEPVIRAELGESDPLPAEDEAATENDVEPLDEGPQVASACRLVEFEEVALTHCIADPAQHRIRTALIAPTGGQPYGSLTALSAASDESVVAFAVNAGMYGDDLRPIGYYVEGGDRLTELNRADGPGNFHLKPNGVFYGTGGTWRVRTADDFYSSVRDRPDFGTQSGPMLVINGELHPEFQDNGPSRAIRNGVGVSADGKAHFVRSEAPISFGQFARYYRDELKTPNALFLDGNVSSLWDPAIGRLDGRTGLGPLLVVTRR